MAYKVEVSEEAEADEVYDWIAEHSPSRAAKWYNGLLNAIRSLAENPQQYPVIPEGDSFDEEVRHLLYGKRKGVYRVLFTIRDDVVYVLHILHAARGSLPGD